MAKLLVQETGGLREFELRSAETSIGRAKANALRLPHPSISSRHCVVRKAASGFVVEDLHSSNGVLLNAKRIQAAPLKDGDKLDLGEIRIIFKDAPPVETAASAPPGARLTVQIRAEDLAQLHSGEASDTAKALGQEIAARIRAGRGVGGNFHEACLTGADLGGANLERADLGGADLSGANLKGANLAGATLKGARLASANLKGANLERTDLRQVDLTGANLDGAKLDGALR